MERSGKKEVEVRDGGKGKGVKRREGERKEDLGEREERNLGEGRSTRRREERREIEEMKGMDTKRGEEKRGIARGGTRRLSGE